MSMSTYSAGADELDKLNPTFEIHVTGCKAKVRRRPPPKALRQTFPRLLLCRRQAVGVERAGMVAIARLSGHVHRW